MYVMKSLLVLVPYGTCRTNCPVCFVVVFSYEYQYFGRSASSSSVQWTTDAAALAHVRGAPSRADERRDLPRSPPLASVFVLAWPAGAEQSDARHPAAVAHRVIGGFGTTRVYASTVRGELRRHHTHDSHLSHHWPAA